MCSSDLTVSVAGASVDVVYGFAKDVTELAKVMDLQPAADFVVDATTNKIKHAKVSTCVITYTAATSATTPPVYDTSGITSANCS